MKLAAIARVVRSKNAGPLTLTLDILVEDDPGFERLLASPALRPGVIAALYGVPPKDVTIVPVRAALALKIVLPRPIVAGSPGDRDVYGAQQHARLLDLDL